MGRRILATGLAGQGIRTTSSVLYDAERVRELLTRPSLRSPALPPACERALLEQRLPPGSDPSTWDVLSNAGIRSLIVLLAVLRRDGFIPLVRSSCGFVVGGGEVVGARLESTRSIVLEVRPPGTWFEAFDGCRIPSPPGHNWTLGAEGITPP